MTRIRRLALPAGLLLAACNSNPQAPVSQHTQDFIDSYYASRGITDKTHGSSQALPEFSPADVPKALPHRRSVFQHAGPVMLVTHSLGTSTVEVMYPKGVEETYSADGKGAPVPVSVRIDGPEHPGALYPLADHRRLTLAGQTAFSGNLWDENNRAAAVALTREVLQRTHCLGGTVTDHALSGRQANAFGEGVRMDAGHIMAPGWVVEFRCSRWRAL